MDVHIDAVLHIQKICKHPICQFRCQDLQITDGTDCLSHQKCLVFGEIEGSRCNEVLGLHTGFRKHFVFKPKRLNPILIENVVHDFQTLTAIQRMCLRPKHLKVIQHICLDTFQPWTCDLQIFRFNAKGNILGLHQTVVPLRQLIFQHSLIFLTDFIKIIIL